MDFVQRCELTKADWDCLVNESPDGWIFALYDWQDLVVGVRVWGLSDYSFGLRIKGKLVAVVPLQLDTRSGIMSSSGWGGAGPIIDAQLAGKARRKAMTAALEHSIKLGRDCGATSFSLSISPVTKTSRSEVWGVNPFVFHNLKDQSGLSQVIDLNASGDELWTALSADARYQIRKAQNLGMTVERADWCSSLDRYYDLHCETYQRTNITPHPEEYFAGIAKRMAPDGYSALWQCKSANGEPVAFHNACWFGEGACYHTGASTAEAGKTGASYLLFWSAMMGAKAWGIRWYDCGAIFPGDSATAKQKGLTLFKTKFGGQAHRLFAAGIDLRRPISSPAPNDTPKSFLDRSKDALARGLESVARFVRH